MSRSQAGRIGGNTTVARHGRVQTTAAARAKAAEALDKRLRDELAAERGSAVSDAEWAEVRPFVRSRHFSRLRSGVGR